MSESEKHSPSADLPDVDVVMPVRNEADYLASAVAAVRAQDYAGRTRIFLSVGPSDDDTEQIAAELAAASDDIVVVDNPSGLTPSALNLAIQAGQAPIVVRVDGHSELSDGYVRRAVATMQRTGAANVGGLQVPIALTPFERAVAAATTSWLGTGGASYRVGGKAGPVDTVYLGVFDRAAIEAVGLFDARLVRNQDYELNIRLRAAGGTVWFDPALSIGYRPRGSWRALARQYFEYGYWKATVMRMHPDSARLRQVVAPLGVLIGVVTSLGALRRPRLAAIPMLGAAVIAVEAWVAARRTAATPLRTATVLVTIPIAWTLGLASSALRTLLSSVMRARPDGTDVRSPEDARDASGATRHAR
jgi:succinoglycan biosynthesis protein ExoA